MKALLFDLDGTLVDSLPLILETSHRALRELGQDRSDGEIQALIGLPLIDTGEVLLGPGYGEPYLHAYQRHFRTLEWQVQAFPGIAALLADMQAAGAHLAVVTSKRRQSALDTLAESGLADYFPVLVTAEDDCGHKPEPGPALAAMVKLAAKPADCLFIGDSLFDTGCANQAGIKSCAVTWGAGSAAELRGTATWLAETVPELRQVLYAFLNQPTTT